MVPVNVVEPFTGSAAVWHKTPCRETFLADVKSDLITFYRTPQSVAKSPRPTVTG